MAATGWLAGCGSWLRRNDCGRMRPCLQLAQPQRQGDNNGWQWRHRSDSTLFVMAAASRRLAVGSVRPTVPSPVGRPTVTVPMWSMLQYASSSSSIVIRTHAQPNPLRLTPLSVWLPISPLSSFRTCAFNDPHLCLIKHVSFASLVACCNGRVASWNKLTCLIELIRIKQV